MSDPKEWLPLTELRTALLAALVLDEEPVEVRYHRQVLKWAVDSGCATYNGRTGHQITDLGRRVLAVTYKHPFSTRRRLLGHSPIKGGGSRYGLALRCGCGFRAETNESRKRGQDELLRDWREHVGKVLAETARAGE